jgi:antitoxin component of MazEF toxin-antitoxin module
MAVQQQVVRKDIQVRRVLEFHNQSGSLGITIPSDWCYALNLQSKDFVKLSKVEGGFLVEKIDL